jgi:exodeoxyribonuclease VII large subunit
MTKLEQLRGKPVFTASQFADVMNGVLSESFKGGVWIEGEVQGMRDPNPHLYFTLGEKIGSKTFLVNITMFRSDVVTIGRKLEKAGALLRNGMRLRLFGRPSFYEGQGKLGVVVTDVDTDFTVGDIAVKRAELIAKLAADGTLDRNKSRRVPLVPLRLGVVSSAQSDGFTDFRKQISESKISFSVTLCDVKVQGDTAPRMIVNAIAALSRRDDIDIVVLSRGGGSVTELATFDDEQIVRAIAACRHPVFTGIGHNKDVSIADMAAHTSAKTPTACGVEIAGIVRTFTDRLENNAMRLHALSRTALERVRGRVGRNMERLVTRPRMAVRGERQKLVNLSSTVRLLDPVTTMARGWSITRTEDGVVVRSVSDVSSGDVVITSLVEGVVTSRVEGES